MVELAPLSGGVVEVLTFKQGLLSRIAHDLLLRSTEHEVRTDGASRVEVTVRLHGLEVVGAVQDGELRPGTLSASDRDKIRENLRDHVLQVDRHPEASFSAAVQTDAATRRLSGTLSLHGVSRSLELTLSERDGRLFGEVELTPSHWGIAPFKALMGAIKLQDRVVVRVDFPLPTP